MRKALAPSAAGNPSAGWVGYSYRVPDALANAGTRSGTASRAELTRALTQPSEYDPVTPPVFAEPTAVPAMGWKTQPTRGHLRGTVKTPDGAPFDQVRVDLYDAETDAFVGSRLTDGSGWFGFADLAPGRYKVIVDNDHVYGQRVAVFTITAGQIATVALTPDGRASDGRPIHDRPGHDPQEADDQPNGER